MRSDCKHYQTRTYPSGDTMRKCGLDLAPKAPWECPADCSSFERRLADVAWNHGSLVAPATPEAPASIAEDDSISALLDSAEDIVNTAAPTVRAEVDAQAEAERRARKKRTGRWWPFNG